MATAPADGSVALGQGAVANQVNTVSVCTVGAERRIVNVAAGTASTDAVNLRQLTAVNTSLGNSPAALGDDTAELFQLSNRNRRDIGDANEGVAMAHAMETPVIPAGTHIAVSGGLGYFKNRVSFASAISVAVGSMSSVSAGLGYGINSKEIGKLQLAFSGEWNDEPTMMGLISRPERKMRKGQRDLPPHRLRPIYIVSSRSGTERKHHTLMGALSSGYFATVCQRLTAMQVVLIEPGNLNKLERIDD